MLIPKRALSRAHTIASHASAQAEQLCSFQAYLDKTNQTMQAAAEQMQALRDEQAGQGLSGSAAKDRQTEMSETSLSAQDAMEAPASSAPPTSSQSSGPDQQIAEGRDSDSAERPTISEGCPYIGFTASTNFMDAQTLWDASMAYSISTHLQREQRTTDPGVSQIPVYPDTEATASSQQLDLPGESASAACSSTAVSRSRNLSKASQPLVLHVCGKFHSEGGMGIPEHLNTYKEGLRLLVVTFLPTSKEVEISPAEFLSESLDSYGDFIILTDLRAPRSYAIEHPL